MEFTQNNELGRKTFFWYRIYCAVLVLLYLSVTVSGIALAFFQPEIPDYTAQQLLIMGSIYALVGAFFLLVFIVALFLPPKPYNWIVGIVMMAIGMTSCCFLPFVVPLFIYWLKPETQAFFGRK